MTTGWASTSTCTPPSIPTYSLHLHPHLHLHLPPPAPPPQVLPSITNEVLKAVVAEFDAGELITMREQVLITLILITITLLTPWPR